MSKKELSQKLWKEFKIEAKKHQICSTEFKAFQKIPRNAIEKNLLSIGASLVGYWDHFVDDNWASLDARALKSTLSEGKIVAGFKRTWMVPAPVCSNLKIVVKKRKGSGLFKTTAKGSITAEKYDEKGKVIERKKIHFPKGDYKASKEITFSGKHFGFILVTVDTDDPIYKFPYAIKYQEIVLKTKKRQVKGFADIHVHQTAEYAYAGRWLHGKMMGDPAEVLKACSKKHHDGKLVNSKILGIDKLRGSEIDETGSFRTHGGGYPSFKDWPHHLDISHQQVHENWLKQAFNKGMRLMVSSAVNSEVLALLLGAVWDKDPFRDMECMKLQINKVHEFCERNQDWAAIAYNPWHAREIIHSNKLAIVLAVECSNLFPKDQGDWNSQLNELYCLGVRSFQIVHHCDNRWGGAAPQERGIVGIQTLSRLTRASLKDYRKKLSWLDFDSWFDEDKPLGFDFDEKGENVRGLSEEGEALIHKMMDMHVMIDTAHYSRRTFNDVYSISQKRDYYPLFNSHTKFKEVLSEQEKEVQREFLTTDDQIIKINKTGGILGLRTAPWSNQNDCCGGAISVKPDREDEIGTARNYAQQVAYANKKNIPFAIGSDFNGFTNQLGPRKKEGKRPKGLSAEYWRKGLHHIGMLPDLVEDLKVLKTPGAKFFDKSAEAFLKMWERTWDSKREKVERD